MNKTDGNGPVSDSLPACSMMLFRPSATLGVSSGPAAWKPTCGAAWGWEC